LVAYSRRLLAKSLRDQFTGTPLSFVCVDERGIVVTLMASKASQDQAESIVVPRQNMPKACQALEAWAAVAKLEAGEAVFRAINQWQHISAERLTNRSVARIVKSRVKELVKQRGRTEAEAEELVDLSRSLCSRPFCTQCHFDIVRNLLFKCETGGETNRERWRLFEADVDRIQKPTPSRPDFVHLSDSRMYPATT
jgi:hypothetical protein